MFPRLFNVYMAGMIKEMKRKTQGEGAEMILNGKVLKITNMSVCRRCSDICRKTEQKLVLERVPEVMVFERRYIIRQIL